MTEAEWRACDNPARMRATISGWPGSQRHWVFFDLACIARVQDLIDDHACLECIRNLANAAEQPQPPPHWFMLGQIAADAALRKTWSRRTDPLKQARIAAFRAVSRLASHTLATSEMVCVTAGRRVGQPGLEVAVRAERKLHADFLRCVFRSTLNSVTFDPAWRSDTAVSVAKHLYESRDFSAIPILADALQDAGCENPDVLNHCREPNGLHVRGCWVVDLVLGKS